MDETYVEEILAEEEQEPAGITLTQYVYLVWQVFENYGWYILALGLILWYAHRKLQPYIDQYNKKKAEYEYAERYHKDPDAFLEQQMKREEVIKRKQEEYQKDLEWYNEKLAEKESKKREERLLKLTGKKVGTKLGSSDYNPLMGNDARTYKPTRKSTCGGGGCG